ncbi:MAG: PAC2 family protein [Actinobacteria bacterium]|nr:PAC2 family protein [Actinomycetota bacterium]
MRDPAELVTVHQEVTFDAPPILLYAFSGFVDAGGGVRQAAEHILAACEHRLIATFDVDELLDYRARRPRMTYVVDHFASVEVQQIVLHEVTDDVGQRFLLLTGPEPDYQWLRFMAAVDLLVARFEVRLAVGLSAIPWPIPHTRPLGITVHGSEPQLVAGHLSVIGEIEVPGHVGAMLELHLGQLGTPSMGITAQVPHYLVQFEFPRAAVALIEGLASQTGLVIPTADLEPAAHRADAEVAQQLDGNEEFASVVHALEQQYDQMAAITSGSMGGLGDMADDRIPTGDEIAAQVEQFLSTLEDPDDPEKETGV